MGLKGFFFFCAVGCASLSQAWGPIGHRQIADIAWSQLSREAKVAITAILTSGDTVVDRGADNVYSVPSMAVTDEYLEKIVRPVFANSANWADTIKYGKSKLFEARIIEDNAESPGVKIPAEGKPGEEDRCKTWHYYDKSLNAPAEKAENVARESNAVRALHLRMKEFEDNARSATPDKLGRVYSLYWIEHIFGDLHQPLHCVENFEFDPAGDAGGNTFKLGISRNPNSKDKWNLHGYWDSGIDHAILADKGFPGGLDTDPSVVSAKWTDEAKGQYKLGEIDNLDPVSWIDRGWKLAKEDVYDGIKPDGIPSPEYAARHEALCKQQALLAGFRLARYLNGVFAKK